MGTWQGMGRALPAIDAKLADFMVSQPVFFVATAPLRGGHVNCSPKGNDGDFQVLDDRRVAYQDMTGSGIETIAHLRENGRLVIMFCAFSGPPRIVRLHGRGQVVVPGDGRYAGLEGRFRPSLGRRSFIVVDVERVSTSCGFGVPLMTFDRHRDNMARWAEAKGPDGLKAYREEKNALSLDGLSGLGGPPGRAPHGAREVVTPTP
jgi:hypothetical protein